MAGPAYSSFGRLSRRAFLQALMGAALVACSNPRAVRQTPEDAAPPAPSAPTPTPSAPQAPPRAEATAPPLPPTPACGGEPTIRQTAGPFFTPNSPERTSLLEPGTTGTRLTVTGYVLTRNCQPVRRALVDFWQADGSGVYDNAGYTFRGHQFTDDSGRYTLETVVPGRYPGRTPHIHVNVQAANQPVLTTQLYFPGEPANRTDAIFRPELVMDVKTTGAGKVATFDFVLDMR